MAPTMPKPPQKRKRLVLTLPKKVELVKRMEKGENRTKLMAEFGVSSSTLYDLKKQKDNLVSFLANTESPTVILDKRKSLRKPKLEELDSALYLWFTAQRSKGNPVTGPMLIEKAKKLREDLEIKTECHFSLGWLHNFKNRHGIRQLEARGERSADQEAVSQYSEDFTKLIQEHNVHPDQVYNADETALFWRCLPSSTLANFKEKDAIGFKHDKDRLTILPCANVTGTHKLKLFMLGRAKNPRALKNVHHLPVHYNANSNAWMTAELFKWWFFHAFVVEVKEFLHEQGLSEDSKVLLLLDNCIAHPPAHQLVSGNIFVAYLLPNVTSLIQPMNQGIIKNFKQFYREAFIRELVNSDVDVLKFQKEFSIKDAIFAAAMSWKDVKKTTIRRCWYKLWPEIVFEDDEDEIDFLGFEDTGQEVQQLQALIPSSHPISQTVAEELEEWMQADINEPTVEEMTDEVIIASIRTPVSDIPPEQLSDDEEEERKKVSWKEAHDRLSKFISFIECSSYYNANEVMTMHLAMKTLLTRKASACKQTDIRKLFEQAAHRQRLTPTPPSSTPSSPLQVNEEDNSPVASTSKSAVRAVSRPLLYSSDSE